MDAVTTVTPLIDGAPMASEATIKALYATGSIIVIDAKDLKNFAIKAGVVVAYVGFMRWEWKRTWKPMVEEHKEHKRFKEAQKAREARRLAELRVQARAEGFELHKVILKQKGTNRKTPVTVKTPAGTTYKEAVELVKQGKAELVD